MINNLNILSIKILNSQYKSILNVLVILLISICFSGNFNKAVLCTNDNLPIIAEPKVPVIKGTAIPSALQVEVSSFLDSAKTMTDQKNIIAYQKMQIVELKNTWEETNLRKIQVEQKFEEFAKKTNSVIMNNLELHAQSAKKQNLLNAANKELAESKAEIAQLESARKRDRMISNDMQSTFFWVGIGLGLAAAAFGSYYEANSENIAKAMANSINSLLKLKK